MLHLKLSLERDIFSYLRTGEDGGGWWRSSVGLPQIYEFWEETEFNTLVGRTREFRVSCNRNPWSVEVPCGDNTIVFRESECDWYTGSDVTTYPYSYDDQFVYIETTSGTVQIDISASGWVNDATFTYVSDCSRCFVTPPERSFRIGLVESTNPYLREQLLQERADLREFFQGFITCRIPSVSRVNWFTADFQIIIDINSLSDYYDTAAEDLVNLVLKRYFNDTNPSPMFYTLDIGPFPNIGISTRLRVFIMLDRVRKIQDPGALFYRTILDFTVRGQRLIYPHC